MYFLRQGSTSDKSSTIEVYCKWRIGWPDIIRYKYTALKLDIHHDIPVYEHNTNEKPCDGNKKARKILEKAGRKTTKNFGVTGLIFHSLSICPRFLQSRNSSYMYRRRGCQCIETLGLERKNDCICSKHFLSPRLPKKVPQFFSEHHERNL